MQTITLTIFNAEEDAIMQQLREWQLRQAVAFDAIDSLLPGKPLTPAEWVEELRQAEASGFVSGEEARKRFGL